MNEIGSKLWYAVRLMACYGIIIAVALVMIVPLVVSGIISSIVLVLYKAIYGDQV